MYDFIDHDGKPGYFDESSYRLVPLNDYMMAVRRMSNTTPDGVKMLDRELLDLYKESNAALSMLGAAYKPSENAFWDWVIDPEPASREKVEDWARCYRLLRRLWFKQMVRVAVASHRFAAAHVPDSTRR